MLTLVGLSITPAQQEANQLCYLEDNSCFHKLRVPELLLLSSLPNLPAACLLEGLKLELYMSVKGDVCFE